MEGSSHTAQDWRDFAEAFAFVGNSLLAPMSQTEAVALDPGFWDGFPRFGDAEVESALADCRAYAEEALAFAEGGGDAVQRASVEYTKLFIGPPRPSAPPWETMYQAKGASDVVGFGEPTFEMQQLLREVGLEVSNENNQYADHMGIELLYASVLSDAIAQAEDDDARSLALFKLRSFARKHPLSWVNELALVAETAQPGGFVARMLHLAQALLAAACRSMPA